MAMYLGSNKVEIGQSSGRGSSDFSTAEVTFVGSGGITATLPILMEGEEEGTGGLMALSTYYGEGSGTQTIALWRGATLVKFDSTPASISGNIMNAYDNFYSITGDCTITIS